MRIATLILSIGMVMMLLGCGLLDDDQKPAESTGKLPSPTSEASEDGTAPSAVSETPGLLTSPVTSETAPDVAVPMSIGYDGPSSLEKRILDSPVIARVRLDSATSSVVSETIFDGSTKYISILEFSFSVLDYLKGSGSGDIVAYWAAAPLFDTRHEAEAALPAIAAARDTRWDDHEATVFLQHPETAFPSTKQPDRYYLSWGGSWSIPDDGYSIASIHNKLWLPAEVAIGAPSQSRGEQQRFLTDVPPDSGTASTITLGELKDRIGAVTAKLAAGTGSEVYRDCLQRTYQYEGINRYRIEKGDEGFFYRIPDQKLKSGLAVSSVVYEGTDLGGLPDWRDEIWFDGGDSDLFNVAFGDSTPFDFSGDGTSDSIQYTQRVLTARPLPAGVYRFHLNHRDAFFVPCQGYTFRYEWQVVVTAPEGTLHEAFFDPITVGNFVAGDSTNGVLKPASFAGTHGATTTIERIAWEPGTAGTSTVKLELSAHNVVTGHILDFIAPDGSVALSLNVSAATVDAANNTLSWPVASQPWQSGDKLMLRIREALCSRGAVTDPGANPGLLEDCEALLAARDTLAGTATLNWSATSTISTWEGVSLNTGSTRVAELELDDEGLNGTIPAGLGELSALVTLDLSDNELTGAIPAELGLLTNLQVLRLSGNSLTGCIPLVLMSVATNDLSSLNLLYCRPPAPENLTAGTPGETSVPLSWGAVANAGTYRVEYRTATSTEWLVDVDNATTTSHVVDYLDCDTDYRFRVSALGSGTVYATKWSEPSEVVSRTTGACNRAPEFATSTYSFTIAEDATTTDLVGTVSATDPDSDPVSHAITSGNSAGKFAIAADTGDITVAGALDHENVPSYTLVVEARDGRDGAATTTVEIEVTDVAEDAPPAPTGLGVSLSTSTGIFTATWSTVTGASNYELQQQASGSAEGWAAVATTAGLTQTYSPTGGPACGTTYEFRVRAYGDGTLYAAVWGEPSEHSDHTTDACNRAPAFATSAYTFSVAEDATTTDPVGTVSATDPDSDPVSHAITSGNSAGRFAIATSTGDITVAGGLDHESVPSYTLVVEARDDRNGVGTTTVEIQVTDVAEDAPPAPAGLGVSLTDGTFTVTWSAVAGASMYELQQQVTGSANGWAVVATTAGLTQTYSPTGGPACGTTYEFRVRAYGDGTAYAATWGAPSEPKAHTTEACNRAPVFGASSYTLTISENAATGTSAGAISATDPDGDPVSHSIIAGNGAGKFTIATSTGAITLTGTVDPDAVAFYALTVEAGDDEGETSTALVGVAVLLDECSNGAVVPRPRGNPRLVRDCSMLLVARDTLAGDASLDWSADTDIDDWQGVTVERGDSPYVRVLFLPEAGLTGSIPAALGGLADLRRIDLDYNSLTGGLPRELGSLYDMELIYLNHNNLTGTIPAELAQLGNLKSLFLSNNNLTGGIPPELGKLRSLTELIIEENSLTGAIPVELGALSNLTSLYLSGNSLTGGIPAELGKLSNLKHLLLERNLLGGEIPAELGTLTRLEHVYLRNMGLTGEIPADWGNLPNLTHLYLSSGNSLTGCIPSGLRDVEESDLDGLGLAYCN